MDILGLRHQPSGLNSHFIGSGLSFAAYVQRTQEMLRQIHEWKNDGEQIIAGNLPFELLPTGSFGKGSDKPYRRGILLTHGLTDSPYQMRHLATFFQRMGFRVMVPLLPGHGTQPGDLLNVRWKEWRKAVNFGASRLAEEVDELYLGGLSAGAALSVLQSAKDKRVCGLFLFSPALEIDLRARWANLHRFYSRWVPKEAWINVMQDRDKYKYESFCKNAAAQMFALTRALPRAGLNIRFSLPPARTMSRCQRPRPWALWDVRACRNRLVWYATKKPDHQNIEWVTVQYPDSTFWAARTPLLSYRRRMGTTVPTATM